MLRYCLALKPKLSVSIFRKHLRRKTTKSRISLPVSERIVVLSSPSSDPFLNLAYENWMYENLDLEKHDILLFWRNSPCVVIGRHQNPWLECNVKELKKHGVKLARRYSGGGTVYHDLGNLNITFFTKRARYNRKRNLESIVEALSEGWDLDVDISPRDDLVVDGIYKFSGSAAKLGKHSSYHHCTLLYDADLEMLSKTVGPGRFIATSKSTQSVTSRVVNLKKVEPSLTFDEITTGIAKAYSRSNREPCVLPLKMFEQYSSDIEKMRLELLSWEWVYGKTAQFTLTHSVRSSSGAKMAVSMEIILGTIKHLTLTPNVVSVLSETLLKEIVTGRRFVTDDICTALDNCIQSRATILDNKTEKQVREIISCILDMI